MGNKPLCQFQWCYCNQNIYFSYAWFTSWKQLTFFQRQCNIFVHIYLHDDRSIYNTLTLKNFLRSYSMCYIQGKLDCPVKARLLRCPFHSYIKSLERTEFAEFFLCPMFNLSELDCSRHCLKWDRLQWRKIQYSYLNLVF